MYGSPIESPPATPYGGFNGIQPEGIGVDPRAAGVADSAGIESAEGDEIMTGNGERPGLQAARRKIRRYRKLRIRKGGLPILSNSRIVLVDGRYCSSMTENNPLKLII